MKRVLYIGRFNPLHLGHLNAIKYILDSDKQIDQVIIGIGTAQESFTLTNPFTAGERFEFLIQGLKEFGISAEKYFIVPIPDVNNNNQWISYLISYLPKFSVIYSNNPLVTLLTEHFEKIQIKSIPLLNREMWSATSIRQKIIANDNSWEKVVPESVKKIIADVNGIQRIQLLAKNDT